jgi:Fuc2NAc and GlcNAc transferase
MPVSISTSVVVVSSAVLSYFLVDQVRRSAIRRNLMDVPNERSSHAVATPRGGGAGIAVAFLVAVLVLWAMELLPATMAMAYVLCGAAVAGIGWLDDRRRLGAASRFWVHAGAACVFLWLVGGYLGSDLAKWGLGAPWAAGVFSLLVLLWATNLFNFMDGIDGLAASESVFITVSAGVLNWWNGGELGISTLLFCTAASCVGFLIWNWPPAKIFMGDVGSGFLGFILAACLMAGSHGGALPIETLPILGGYFVVDASVTLLRRMSRGDRWTEAHRTHAYQHLTRRFGRHLPVTLLIGGINLGWLLPWAIACSRYPEHARLCLAGALLPLVIFAIGAGAGHHERAVAAS